MMLFEKSSQTSFLSESDLREGIAAALDALGPVRRMLIVPPDITRLHSAAGTLTRIAYEHDSGAVAAILPALGTHKPMTAHEIATMFGAMPSDLFSNHLWRTDCVRLGEIPQSIVEKLSRNSVSYAMPVEVNKTLVQGKFDCILSIGQVVPHEVAGVAGHNKNIFVGLGGAENIHKSHFLGAAYGIEKILGQIDSPVRAVIDYGMETFLGSLPLVHALTVVDRDEDGALRPRGLYVGKGKECFRRAADLACRVNIFHLEKPLSTVVVYLDPVEYKSFWLGNKSIYRTRKAIADHGRLIVLAPGVNVFGEDPEIDRLIRAYGYKGTPHVLDCVARHQDLSNNLSAAAHLIHGSTEGRFSVTYCPGGMERTDVENAGFEFASVKEMLGRYNPARLRPGPNVLPGGEEIFFIPNPATGLWMTEGSC